MEHWGLRLQACGIFSPKQSVFLVVGWLLPVSTRFQQGFCSMLDLFGQNRFMPIKNRSTHSPPEVPEGEGWLVNADQQKLVHFTPDKATAHAQWVILRTYRWVPPRPPTPQTRRRMLRHNAIEAWTTMLKTGWRQCSAPVR